MKFETIKTEHWSRIINGVETSCKVDIQYTHDDEPLEGSFDFGNDAENELYLDRFIRGDLVNLLIRVRATAEGCEGVDVLGGCHIQSGHADTEIVETALDHGMVEVALDQLETDIKCTAERMQKFLKKGA